MCVKLHVSSLCRKRSQGRTTSRDQLHSMVTGLLPEPGPQPAEVENHSQILGRPPLMNETGGIVQLPALPGGGNGLIWQTKPANSLKRQSTTGVGMAMGICQAIHQGDFSTRLGELNRQTGTGRPRANDQNRHRSFSFGPAEPSPKRWLADRQRPC